MLLYHIDWYTGTTTQKGELSLLELWIVRHGETDWNASGRIQGWHDVPLNNRGRQQAQILADALQGIPFIAIVSSDLRRASETAAILQCRLGAQLIYDADLRERCFGSMEGLTREDSDRRYPSGAPDVESREALRRRARCFLERTRNRFTNGRVICTTHGGMIRCLLEVLGHTGIDRIHNTSVTRIAYHNGAWNVLALNCDTHLGTVADFDESAEPNQPTVPGYASKE